MGKTITKGKKRMKKAIAMLLAISMTAALAIGGTLAYLTDTDEDVNVMTLGQVKIDQLEYERVDVESADDKADVQEFHDNKPLLPAVTDKDFTYTPGDSYVNWVLKYIHFLLENSMILRVEIKAMHLKSTHCTVECP